MNNSSEIELKRHAPSASDYLRSIYILLGIYAALGVFLAIYIYFLSKSDIVYNERVVDAYFNLSKLPPADFENDAFVQPVAPPPLKEETIEVPEIVDSVLTVEKDTVQEPEVVNENLETGNNTETNGGSTTSGTDEGMGGEGDIAGVFLIVDKMPEFPGGDFALRKYIAEHVKYPQQAIKSGIRGLVYVRFCVTLNGDVDRVEVVRGIHPLLDQEALRVVKELPKWAPGERKGKKVNVWYSVPINFQFN